MRITVLFAAVVMMVAAVSSSFAQVQAVPGLKIGYINSAEILEKYSCAKDAEARLKGDVDKWEMEAKTRANELQSLQDQLEKQSMLLTMERKKELSDSLQKKYAQYQEYGQKKQTEAMDRRAELFKPVQDSINKIIQKVGLDEKYDIIFDAINGSVVYALPKYDATKSIIDLLPPCSVTKGTSGKADGKKDAGSSKKK